MRTLLDVNVLIALLDTHHAHHDLVTDWFGSVEKRPWASCPLTENGFVRIVILPSYPLPVSFPQAIRALATLRSETDHQFWPDSISLTNASDFEHEWPLSSKQITDTYLLALAKAHGGMLATLDRKLTARAVPGGEDHLLLIE